MAAHARAGVRGRGMRRQERTPGLASTDAGTNLPPDQQDAHDARPRGLRSGRPSRRLPGSHRGRPAATLRQMGIESLTPTTVRRMVNLQREPVVTVAFRRPETSGDRLLPR